VISPLIHITQSRIRLWRRIQRISYEGTKVRNTKKVILNFRSLVINSLLFTVINLVSIYSNDIIFAKDLSNKRFSPPRHQDTKLFIKIFFLCVLVPLWLIFPVYPGWVIYPEIRFFCFLCLFAVISILLSKFWFSSAEPFDPELTTEGLVAGQNLKTLNC